MWGSRGLGLFCRQSGSGAELTASITHKLLDRDWTWEKKLDASQGMLYFMFDGLEIQVVMVSSADFP